MPLVSQGEIIEWDWFPFISFNSFLTRVFFNHPSRYTAEAKRQAKKERKASKGRVIRG